MTDKRKVVAAVNFLVESRNCNSLIREIGGIVGRWEKKPMLYSGKLEVLNALIDVGVAKRAALEQLFELVRKKRELMPQVKRADYQRDLMNERRQRQYKALELHQLTRGPLKGDKRTDFVARVQQEWMAARNKFILRKGKLDWKGRNDAAAEFWSNIDKTLDANLFMARKKARGRT